MVSSTFSIVGNNSAVNLLREKQVPQYNQYNIKNQRILRMERDMRYELI